MWGVGIFVCRQWWRQYRTHLHILVPHPLLPAQLHNHYILTTMLCTQYQILHNSAFLIYFFILLYAVFISWYASLCCVYILICFFMQCLYLDMPLYAVFISWYASLCRVYILICFFMQCLYLDMLLYAVFISWYASLRCVYILICFFMSFIFLLFLDLCGVCLRGDYLHTPTPTKPETQTIFYISHTLHTLTFLSFIRGNKNPTARNSENER